MSINEAQGVGESVHGFRKGAAEVTREALSKVSIGRGAALSKGFTFQSSL